MCEQHRIDTSTVHEVIRETCYKKIAQQEGRLLGDWVFEGISDLSGSMSFVNKRTGYTLYASPWFDVCAKRGTMPICLSDPTDGLPIAELEVRIPSALSVDEYFGIIRGVVAAWGKHLSCI